MAKKITAPHSYDPGKGRPQEYLAYLNAREMAYLRSINGNNMERGPRGLPSFPPKDAIGSSSNAPSKSPASSGVGRDSSRGIGQGAGGAAVGRGPSGGNPSGGGNLGGGGKGAPGSSPSSPGGLRGAGGNYGPGSGRPGTTSSTGGGYKGPSSPMSGQGPSSSNDTKARQEAQVRDAIRAVKNSPAFRNDASSGGIRTLSVGPMGTPVNVGPRVTPTQNRASVVGGWGAQAFNSAMPKAPSLASPMTAPPGYRPKDADQIQRSLYGSNKQIYDRVPIGKQFKELGIGYDERIPAAPLGPREYSPYGMDIPTVVGRPNLTPEQQAQAGAELQRREQELRDFLNREADPFPTGNPNMAGNPTVAQSRGLSFVSPAEASFPDPEEKILKVENVPESAGMSFTPSLPTYSVKDPVSAINREKYINAVTPSAAGNPFQKVSGVGDVYDPNAQFSEQPKIPSNIQGSYPGGVRSIDVGEPTDDAYRNEGTAPSQDPGTPAPGENPALGPAYPEDNFIEKGLKKAGIWGKLYAGADWAAKKKFDKMTLPEQREEMARWQQLKENTRRNVQGKNNRVGGSTSTTSPGGGITDIGSGGKNEPPPIEQAEKEATKPKPKPKEGGPRPAIYYKWDLGVDVPSPTDSDYTLYLKYLQEKAAAKAGMAR